MRTIRGAVLCRSQEPRTQSVFPTWVAGTQGLEPSSLLLRSALVASLNQELQLGINQKSSYMGCGYLNCSTEHLLQTYLLIRWSSLVDWLASHLGLTYLFSLDPSPLFYLLHNHHLTPSSIWPNQASLP